jgi:dolichol-phosphate mannosyltransferase
MKQLSVILPTYNEAENIPIIIEKLTSILSEIDYEIIVVDDDSPDCTWEKAMEIGRIREDLLVIRRVGRRGLSSAIVEGFLAARGEKLLVTDADMQHDLTKIPEMYQASKNVDLVIGTRYAKGGEIENWSPKRLGISKLGTKFSQYFIRQKVTDPLSGFFLIDAALFHKISPNIKSDGFKILIEILIKFSRFSVAEVPYSFKARKFGESKINSLIFFDFIDTIFSSKIRVSLGIPLFKFLTVGSAGLCFSLSAIHFLFKGIGNYPVSLVFSIYASILFNFSLGKLLIGEQFDKAKFSRYFLRRQLGAISSIIVALSLFGNGINYIYSTFIGILIGVGWNFVGDKAGQ